MGKWGQPECYLKNGLVNASESSVNINVSRPPFPLYLSRRIILPFASQHPFQRFHLHFPFPRAAQRISMDLSSFDHGLFYFLPIEKCFYPLLFHQKKEKRKKEKGKSQKRTQWRKPSQNQSSQLLAHSPLFHTHHNKSIHPTHPTNPPTPSTANAPHPPTQHSFTPGDLPTHQRSQEGPISTKMPPSISAPFLPPYSPHFPRYTAHTIPHVPFESCCSHLPTAPSRDLTVPYPNSPPPRVVEKPYEGAPRWRDSLTRDGKGGVGMGRSATFWKKFQGEIRNLGTRMAGRGRAGRKSTTV